MIKRYKQFVNESINSNVKSKDEIEELRNNWVDEVINVSLEQNLSVSYSTLCKRKNGVPVDDYLEYQKYMDEKGFTINVIKDIFSKEAKEITGKDIFEVIEKSPLDNQSGDVDTYLYFTIKNIGLDANKYDLGGPGWGSYLEPDEAIIRYSYGYHKTKYGQLFIQQIGITEDDFREVALKGLTEEFYNNWETIIKDVTSDDWRARAENKSYLDYKKWLITEKDRIIILTSKLLDAINSESDKDVKKEELDDAFSKFFLSYDFEDFDITDYEFVVYCESTDIHLLNT